MALNADENKRNPVVVSFHVPNFLESLRMKKPAPTAAILVIGNEILSGGTQDANISFIGKKLSECGIKLCEVRIVGDERGIIAGSLNALRNKYTYVFTTGGIGPTHDDITAESVAYAFNVACPVNDEARYYMTQKYAARGVEMNDGRLRMARIPEGGSMIHCAESIAPGFRMENVFVMAGIPRVMQSQFLAVEPLLEKGPAVLSLTVQCNLKEGDIALDLEAIQKDYPSIDIGSYPHMNQTPSLSLILRGTDESLLAEAGGKVAAMVTKHGDTPLSG